MIGALYALYLLYLGLLRVMKSPPDKAAVYTVVVVVVAHRHRLRRQPRRGRHLAWGLA